MIGDYSAELCAIAKATGGYAFHPSRLKDGLKLCELETLLRSQERASMPSPPTSEWNQGCVLLALFVVSFASSPFISHVLLCTLVLGSACWLSKIYCRLQWRPNPTLKH